MTVSPNSLISIFGHSLTSGSTLAADPAIQATKLAGTQVKLDGTPIPLLYVSPGQVNALVPSEIDHGEQFHLALSVAGGGFVTASLQVADATPGIFTLTASGRYVTLWGTGLGPVTPIGDLEVTRTQPTVTVAGLPAQVLFSGLSPGTPGLYQVNVQVPDDLPSPALLDFEFAGVQFLAWIH
jgi:uncharacterized protein (TIGR03437 family)